MPEQTTHPSPEELAAYGLGQLPPDEAAVIESHISECQPCCETIVGLSSDDTFVSLLKEARQLPADQTIDQEGLPAKASSSLQDVPAPLAEHPRYEIVGLIGKGGMGDVYKARHRMMERTVALKIINRELVRKPEVVDRFHREVKTAAQLSHPNIVTAYDAEQAGDFHFLVMEHVDGVDLSQTVKDRGALPIADACDYIRQAAIGLQHAHQQGMVHRDIKPHNLMVTADGTVKILDFGLASLAPEALSIGDTAEARGDLTAAGAIMGTPDFISPEQADDARQADIRSDIYSLGTTLYFLLSGRPPFTDGSVMHKLKSHAQADPEPLESLRDDIPAELANVVAKMMAKDPNERFQTPAEVAEALESFSRASQEVQQQTPPHQIRPGRQRSRILKLTAVATLFVAAIVATVVYYIQTNHGTVRVEVTDPSMKVTISGQTINMKEGNKEPLEIRAGECVLIVRQGDFEFETDNFQIRRNEDIAFKVERLEGEVVVSKDGERFKSLALPNVWSPPENPDPQAILQEAHADTRAKNYKIALAKHVWLHKHALSIDPAFYGVRLSFALSYWLELAKQYPPALEELKEIRDEAEKNVLAGKAVRESFQDMAIINKHLDEHLGTKRVFEVLDKKSPNTAKQVFNLAQPSLVRSEAYSLIGKYIAPKDDFAKMRQTYRRSKISAGDPRFGASLMDSANKKFANDSTTLVAILTVNGRKKEAEEIAASARKEWDDPSFHVALEKALKGVVPDPWPSHRRDGDGLRQRSQPKVDGKVEKTAGRSDDHKNIQGSWQVTYSEDSGRIAPQKMLKNLRFVFTQHTMTTEIAGRKSESTYKLDPSTNPKSVDFTENGRTKPGIYDLQGDTLRICFAEERPERPTAFDSQPDSPNDVIIMLKRIRSGQETTSAATQIQDLEHALDLYKLDCGTYPSTEQGLKALQQKPADEKSAENWTGLYLKELPTDPWGNPFGYELPRTRGGDATKPRIWSWGPDGKDNTKDDIRNWEPTDSEFSPEIAALLAKSGQSEAEFKKTLHTVLSQAASIPNPQWEKFATDPSASTAGIAGEPLSLVFWALNPIQASKENPDVLQDFRYLTDGLPRPTELHKAMSSSQPHGYVSMIQPEHIKSTTMDIDVAEKVLRGSVEFESPDLYAGKANFVMEFESGRMRIVEFALPTYGITIAPDDQGVWHRQPAASQANDLSPQQILDRMVKAYADCKSYRDSGVVTTVFVSNVKNTVKRTVKKSFTTVFVRPDRFRFEYKDDNRRYLVWANRQNVQTWWDVQPGIQKPASLQLALVAATGVSGGSAARIPAMLMPEQLRGWGSVHISDAKRIKDGKLENVECFRLEGKHADNPITLWIDKNSYLVRRIDEKAKFDDFRTETTTTYDPTINGKITDKMLEFDPPGTPGQETTSAATQIQSLESALDLYKLDCGTYPSTEQGLNALLQKPADEERAKRWRGPYLKGLPADPWGNAFGYEFPGTRGGDATKPRIWSWGPDGKHNTDDDIRNWEPEADRAASPARTILEQGDMMLDNGKEIGSRHVDVTKTAPSRERDGILSKLVDIAQAGRSRGTTSEEDVRTAKLKLLCFRRDSASSVQEKIRNQELILDLVEARRKIVEGKKRAALASETELLEATDRVLAEKQLLAELRIQQKQD